MKTHPLEALSERYLSKQEFSRATIKSYRNAYKYFIQYLTDHQIEYATTSDIIDYREQRRTKGYSSPYIYIHICALKGLYRYLRIHQTRLGLPEVYAYDITETIQNERIKPRITKPILSIQQAKHMIETTKERRHHLWEYRDHAIVYLMLTCGLRRFDIVQAKRCDYQSIAGKRVLFLPRQGQPETPDQINIPPGAEEALNDYLSRRTDDNPHLFISHKKVSQGGQLSRTFFRHMFARVLQACGLEHSGITPHCLRHTAAVMNVQRGGSIEQTRQLLRHADIQSTMVYVDYLKQMNDDTALQIEQFLLTEDAEDDVT